MTIKELNIVLLLCIAVTAAAFAGPAYIESRAPEARAREQERQLRLANGPVTTSGEDGAPFAMGGCMAQRHIVTTESLDRAYSQSAITADCPTATAVTTLSGGKFPTTHSTIEPKPAKP